MPLSRTYTEPMFDYFAVAHNLQIPLKVVQELETQVKKEFPDDSMLMELHMLRAVRARAAQQAEEQR